MSKSLSKSARRRERRRRAKEIMKTTPVVPGNRVMGLEVVLDGEGELSLEEQVRISEAMDDEADEAPPAFVHKWDPQDDGGCVLTLRLEPRHAELLKQLAQLTGTTQTEASLVILRGGLIARKAEIRDNLGMGGGTTRKDQPTG